MPAVNASVSFFTCCYKADWEFFLKEGRLKEMIDRCNYPFASKNLIINNVDDKQEVIKYADLAISNGVIDNYFFSEDYIDEVLKKFSIKPKDFRLDGYDGYWYSIAPLTAVFLCSSSYILYFTGDCMLDKKYSFNWIGNGIDRLKETNIFCVSLLWDYYSKQMDDGIINEDEMYLYDNGFSDQCFLCETKKLNADIYNEYNAKSEIFPIYGGNHFERRVFSYVNNKEYLRCMFKNIIYIHGKLVKPEFYKEKKYSIKDETKYIIAKIKKIFRRRNILVKFLLR